MQFPELLLSEVVFFFYLQKCSTFSFLHCVIEALLNSVVLRVISLQCSLFKLGCFQINIITSSWLLHLAIGKLFFFVFCFKEPKTNNDLLPHVVWPDAL